MSNTVLMELIDELKNNIHGALIASDIWEGGKGESLAGYNAQPVATKLFDDFHSFLESNLTASKFPPLARYFLLELEDNNAVIVLNYGDIKQGMLVNLNKANMGQIVSLTIPKLFRKWKTLKHKW